MEATRALSLVDGVAARFQCCWVVERTFGGLNHSRRLSKSYERLTRTDEAWISIAMTRIMLERLA